MSSKKLNSIEKDIIEYKRKNATNIEEKDKRKIIKYNNMTFAKKDLLFIEDVNKDCTIKLNKICVLTRPSHLCTAGGEGLLKKSSGRFTEDLGCMLMFVSSKGIRECVSKWDLGYGEYRVEYVGE